MRRNTEIHKPADIFRRHKKKKRNLAKYKEGNIFFKKAKIYNIENKDTINKTKEEKHMAI